MEYACLIVFEKRPLPPQVDRYIDFTWRIFRVVDQNTFEWIKTGTKLSLHNARLLKKSGPTPDGGTFDPHDELLLAVSSETMTNEQCRRAAQAPALRMGDLRIEFRNKLEQGQPKGPQDRSRLDQWANQNGIALADELKFEF